MTLAILFATTFVVGCHLGARFTRAGQRIDQLLARHARSEDVCDAADLATDGVF